MSKVMPPLSIVVPALNEAENLPLLIQRMAQPLVQEGIEHEILIIDDHSTDNSAAVVKRLARTYNVRLVMKEGQRGKAYSLLEGFDKVKYNLICMIDADLQYPPEAIVPMYRKLLSHNADVVITNRVEHQTSALRKLSTKVFHFFMTRLLFGIDYDTQSGLKLFRRHVLNGMDLKPSAWSFDLEFLIRSLENNRTILSFAIPFGERYSGEAKINPFTAAYAMTKSSIKLRLNSSTRKVRQGYQASMKLSQRPAPMSMLFVAGLLASTVLVAGASTQSALAASVIEPVRNVFTPSEKKEEKTETAKPAQQQPAAQQTQTQTQAQPQQPRSGSGDAGTPAPSAPAAQPAQVAQPTSAAPVAAQQPSRKIAQAATTEPARPQTTRTSPETDRTTAATKSQSSNQSSKSGEGPDYYANQSLSADRTSQLITGSKWAALIGGGIVVLAALAWAIRSLHHKHQRKVSRNLYRV